jgi:hypothetical protein
MHVTSLLTLVVLTTLTLVSCTTINLPPTTTQAPVNAVKAETAKPTIQQQSAKEAYSDLIHLKGLKNDTCDLKTILKLIDQTMIHLSKTTPLSGSRLDSIKIAIHHSYEEFNLTRHAIGSNQRLLINEEEMRKRLMKFIE